MKSTPAKRRRKRAKRGPVLVAIAVGLGSGLLLAAPLNNLLNGKGLGNPGITNPFTAWTGIGNQDILLVGTDVGGGNTDVISVLRVDGDTTKITQVPRDSYIEAEGYGPHKINALYSLGGLDLLKRELSRKLDRPISHHVMVNLSAIRRMADAIGGIEVNVPKRMHYVDNTQGLYIDLYPGEQLLRGKNLEGFLRFRHDEQGDLGRMERQRMVMAKVFAKLAQPATLTRLPALMQIAGNDAITDLSPLELTGLASAMAHTKLNIQRLPGRAYWQDNLSYWMPDTNTQHPPVPGEADGPR